MLLTSQGVLYHFSHMYNTGAQQSRCLFCVQNSTGVCSYSKMWSEQKYSEVYPLSLTERNSLDTWIDEKLRKEYIYPSTSPIAAPFFFVKKHNRSLRPIMDYRALNAITVKNHYPIPRIADLIESLRKASIFTKIDLR